METVRLIYASTAVDGLQMNDMISIGEVAAANNKLRGLTGFLSYSSGKFMQALEGSSEGVNRVLQRLYEDHRHSDLQIISFGPIEKRAFPTWAMRSVNWDEAWRPSQRAYLLQQLGITEYEPRAITPARALALLEVLAEVVRRRDERTERQNQEV
ncbi:MAG TPA: BLUF domain-containing protein [Gemmatimonadaceae bacterium]|nr:BLUF domain-containing protein [Gemmatimonadaceae bacterium]